MPIKLEDIRIGDNVTLHAKIVEGGWTKGSTFTANVGGASLGIALADIATHTPAPREFTHGDPVTWGRGFNCGTFLMSYGGLAFIAHEDGTPDTIQVAGLRHAAPAPAPQEPVKERKKIEAWVNVYQGGLMHVFSSNRSAVLSAGPGRRIACLHVEGYEGDGL